MPLLLIEPHDPLIARDGRAFDPTPGARATSLTFPLPSTLAGAVRTQLGTQPDGSFKEELLEQLLGTSIRGPLLAECGADGQWRLLAHAPADALLLTDHRHPSLVRRKQLVPLRSPKGLSLDEGFIGASGELSGGDGVENESTQPGGCMPRFLKNLFTPGASARPGVPGQRGDTSLSLALVGPQVYSPGKPLSAPPRFWYWSQLEAWLTRDGTAGDDFWLGKLADNEQLPAIDRTPEPLTALGHGGPQGEQRTHVAILQESQTAAEGMLFQTRGLEFRRGRAQLGLVVAVDEAPHDLASHVAPLGGERRLAHWRTDLHGLALPEIPDELMRSIVRPNANSHSCRLLLLTPAFFSAGWRPTWLCEERDGVRATLVGAAVGRAQVGSGWDLHRRQPKPSRRLAPAGSVYFLRLSGSPDAVRSWVHKHWLKCVSDDEQARSDGFGLAVVGAWSGALPELQMEEQRA